MWPFTKTKRYCLMCGDEVDPNNAAQVKFRYVEDGEAKIGVEYVHHKCAETLEEDMVE